MIVTAFSRRYYPEEIGLESFSKIESAIKSLNHDLFKLYDMYYKHTYSGPWSKDPDYVDILEETMKEVRADIDRTLPQKIVNAKKRARKKGYEQNLPEKEIKRLEKEEEEKITNRYSDPTKERPVYHQLYRKEGYDSYYANSLEPTVLGILKSQVSNQERYASEEKDRIEERLDKIEKEEKKLDRKLTIKSEIRAFQKTGAPQSGYVSIDKDGTLTGWGIKPINCFAYEYEVERDIRRIKNRIKQLKWRNQKSERKVTQLENLPPKRAIFGSRALFRKKDTVEGGDNWKQEFMDARFSHVTIAGRNDNTYGNRLVQWDLRTKVLTWELPKNMGTVTIPEFSIARYQDEFEIALKNGNAQKKPVGYTFELRRDKKGEKFLIIKVEFTILTENRVNDTSVDGYVSYDTNTDHFAWADISADGKLLDWGVIPFDLYRKTQGQASDIVGRAVCKLVTIAKARNKPLVREKLDAQNMRRSMLYKDKKRNYKISSFCVNRMIEFVNSRAAREGVAVLEVNPAYTSFLGKIVFMREYGISIHCAAAYMIGLKALGLQPEIPERYKLLLQRRNNESNDEDKPKDDYWKQVKRLNKTLSGIRTHVFYMDIPEFKTKKELKNWISENDKTDKEYLRLHYKEKVA